MLHCPDLGATVAAILADRAADAPPLPLRPASSDWHLQRFAQRPHRLVLFAVDASDSMGDGPETRMAAALGAAAALARRAYLNRDQVALITFRDRAATLVVPPTGSAMRVHRLLRRLVVGGATPLADGLRLAGETLRNARRKDPLLELLLVLVSDGDATVPLRRGGDPLADALAMAAELRQSGIAGVVIDTGTSPPAQRQLPRLARELGATCRHLHELTGNNILRLLDAGLAARVQP